MRATRDAGTSRAWRLGWLAGLAVVVIAAGLLLTLIALARRIARQADDVADAIDGARGNTAPLWDIAGVNLELDRIVRRLRPAPESR